MSILSNMKKFVNSKVAMKTTVGVAAAVASASIVSSAMGAVEANDTVEHHARTINSQSNRAAEILDIDRNQLVNTNYLRLANTIDDYLTGRSDKLEIDPSMFGTAEAAEDLSLKDLDPKSAEAFNRISSHILESEESEHDANVEDSPTDVVDITSIVRSAASDGMKSIVDKFDQHEQESAKIAPPSNESSQTDKISADDTHEDEDHQKDSVQAESNNQDLKTAEAVIEHKRVEQSDQIKSKEDEQSVKAVEDIVEVHRSEDRDKQEERKVTAIENLMSKDSQKKSISETQSSIENASDNKSVEAEVIRTDSDSDGNGLETQKSNSDLESGRDFKSEKSEIERFEETRVDGKLNIELSVEYGNHHKLANITIVKDTIGSRQSDGSIKWMPVKISKSDLPEDFMNSEIWEIADLKNPNFEAEYLPSNENDTVKDRLTFYRLKNTKQSKSETRNVRFVREDGSVIKSITQSKDETLEIPEDLDDLFTDQSGSLQYSEGDVEIVYKERYRTVEEIEDFKIEDLNESGEILNSYNRAISIEKRQDLKTNMILSTNEDDAVKNLVDSLDGVEDHDLVDSEVDTANRRIIRRFKSVASIDRLKSDSSEVTPERVKNAADKMLSSMPTLSNRAEYSRYTSLNDFDEDLLTNSTISKLVFEISDGYYDQSSSDRSLSPSSASVKLVELNNRFTDRLIERINTYRRSLGLNEISKQRMNLSQERMYASHVIYNYLANDHSSSEINERFKEELGVLRLETMQPVHKLTVANQGLTPEAAADSLFRNILNESNSYLNHDGGEIGHLTQLLDPEIKTVYAGMFIGKYDKIEQSVKIGDDYVQSSAANEYSISSTLQYYK